MMGDSESEEMSGGGDGGGGEGGGGDGQFAGVVTINT